MFETYRNQEGVKIENELITFLKIGNRCQNWLTITSKFKRIN